MTHTPTSEQQAAIDFARERSENFQVRALAGAAKTSTLVMIAEALPTTAILCLAFNKKIALEMKERLPTNCESMTLNSLGHRVFGKFLGKHLRVDGRKTYNIIKDIVDNLPGADKEEAYSRFSDYIRYIGFGKANGWVPDKSHPAAYHLMSDDEYFSELDEEPNELDCAILRKAMRRSIDEALDGNIDFDDQIYMSALWPTSFPNYPLVMVDEAQDLAPLNHYTLTKLARKRLIAVGDPCQAIYGFRGAHESSMDVLRETFQMETLQLSCSFRCPQAVVEEARWRAPHMQYPEWAKPGNVESWARWSADQLPEDAVILCRNNAPLFSTAIKLFAAGRFVEIVGNDIGKHLLKTLKSLSNKNDNPEQEVLLARIDSWEQSKLKKSRAKVSVRDLAACMRVFAEAADNLRAAIAYAERIMNAMGPVKMMTGHKSKGLEFNNVFILDRELCRINKEDSQDKNILYVMQTRSMDRLTYINSEDFT